MNHNDENEWADTIRLKISRLQRELAHIRANPHKNFNVYQAIDRTEQIEQEIDDLQDKLENI